MREREAIVAAWNRARTAGREAVLATVVRIDGSAYRSIGARMLVLDHGERIGSVSGGCLEHDIVKKAFWLTAEGPTVVPFSTRTEEDSRPYGMGCEGVVYVLLERVRPSSPCVPVELLAACRQARAPGALATVVVSSRRADHLSDVAVGDHVVVWPDGRLSGRIGDPTLTEHVGRELRDCLRSGSAQRSVEHHGSAVEILFELVEPPRSLVVFGGGDDAMPVVRIAKELGWHVTVADGRAHYATTARFPLADLVVVTQPNAPLGGVRVPTGAACVVMTHSFEQDRAALAALSALPIGYLGLLGPRARRDALLQDLAPIDCVTGLHSPVGLDIGSDSPEEIALAIVAEAHACLAGRSGGPLRDRHSSAIRANRRPALASR